MEGVTTRVWLGGILMTLVAAGLIAAVVPVEPAPSDWVANDWVRTVDGWERAEWRAESSGDASLHPLVPALGIGILAVLVLVAFPHPAETVQTTPIKIRPLNPPHGLVSQPKVDVSQLAG
jgi:hypothetical protein